MRRWTKAHPDASQVVTHRSDIEGFSKIERFQLLPAIAHPSSVSQSTHAQRERAETFVAKINVIVYHGAVLDRGFSNTLVLDYDYMKQSRLDLQIVSIELKVAEVVHYCRESGNNLSES